ncbi:MAG: Peptidoglycan-N-acetylmuramic acid deacetylase PdaA precursor [Alphaproteobacteria bacterium ADurb.Bin438]|nr:MAG: Peptidoglycan-N-acetylmuramic acid deacetylase PdaA precursor [Alphaproteobacteria bacterium ADurb.Bin438]
MKQIYLTIDDAPSSDFLNKVKLLKDNEIPAVFFARGDRLDNDKAIEEVSKAILDGFVIGNHLYSHTRVSTLSFEVVKEEIIKTDKLIEQAYKRAGVEQKQKYLRFPYLDRGCGALPVDKNKTPLEYQEKIKEAMGLIQITSPLSEADEKLIEHKNKIQELLKSLGYSQPLFDGVNYDWFKNSEFYTGFDVNMTMATGDSNLLPKYRYKGVTINDIFKGIDENFAKDINSAEIIIMHDYDQEGMDEIFKTIINHLKNKVKFI